MAQVRDYMDYLEGRYGFAPVNSQEEVIAAQTIADALAEHELPTKIEEFSAPAWGRRLYAIPMILLFVAVILCFFNGPARVIGVLLLLICVALLVVWRLQIADPFAKLGPKAQSQNVIAMRPATGVPEDERPGRPIVIMAHYDSGREELLSHPTLSPWRGRIVAITTYTVPVLCLLTLLSLLPPLPGPARYLFLVISLFAAVPTLLWGISNIGLMVGPLTAGSVDNKSSVAALLSLADKVCYGKAWHPSNAPAAAPAPAVRPVAPRAPEPKPAAEYAPEPEPLENLGQMPVDAAYPYPVAEEELSEEGRAFLNETLSPNEETATIDTSEVAAELAQDAVAAEEEVEADITPEQKPDVEAAADDLEAEGSPDPVRHGGAIIRELGILPESCDVVYLDSEGNAESVPTVAGADETLPEETLSSSAQFESDPIVDTESWGTSEFMIDVPRPSSRAALKDVPDITGQLVEEDPIVTDRAGSGTRGIPSSSAPRVGDFDVITPGQGAQSAIPETTRKSTGGAFGALSKFFAGSNSSKSQQVETANPSNDWSAVDDEYDSGDASRSDDSWKGGAKRSDRLRFVPTNNEKSSSNPTVEEAPAEEVASEEANDLENTAIVEPQNDEVTVVESVNDEAALDETNIEETTVEADAAGTEEAPAEANEPVEAEEPVVEEVVEQEVETPAADEEPVEEASEETVVDEEVVETAHDDAVAEEGDAEVIDEEAVSEPESVESEITEPEPAEPEPVEPEPVETEAAAVVVPEVPLAPESVGEPEAYSVYEPDMYVEPEAEFAYEPEYDSMAEAESEVADERDSYDPNATVFMPVSEMLRDASSTVDDIFAEEQAAVEQGVFANYAAEAIAEEAALETLDYAAAAEVAEEAEYAAEEAVEEALEEELYADFFDGVDFDLIEAITAMGDADLLRHDIWFVATGASELDHAGASNFLEAHQRELRGAFVINLSSIGAGELTVITDEGVVPHRRSDRRIVRHLLSAAETLHIPLDRASITWGDTDAMALMRHSMRSATVMGCSSPGIPALSHTSDDVPGVTNKRKIAEVVELVAEAIRRS